MNNERFMVPLDEALDPDCGFNSAAAREWFDEDLSDYGLGEDCHFYSISESP